MIKIDNNIFYMTMGRACYVSRLDGDRLKNVWFGERVEPEDDLSALSPVAVRPEFEINGGARGDFTPSVAVDVKTGKRVSVDFKFVSASVEDKRECPLPTLRGEDTLKIVLEDKAAGLRAELYYTPYIRGAIARRAEIVNTGKRTLAFRAPSACVRVPAEMTESERGELNYISLAAGELAYGFLALIGSPMRITVTDDGLKRVELCADEDVALAPGERFYTPEAVCAFSDLGEGGLKRIIHDIIRADAYPERIAGKRRPITMDINSADEVEEAAALGVDAVVAGGKADLKAVCEKCRACGVIFGVRAAVTPDTDGAKLAEEFKTAGVEYVAVSAPQPKTIAEAKKLYAVYAAISGGERIIETPPDLGAIMCAPVMTAGGDAEPLPPCALITRIDGRGDFKSSFDIASTGGLGYSLDVGEMSDGIKRAVRAQVFSYQDDSALVAGGDLYATRSMSGDVKMFVSKDKSKAYAVFVCVKRSKADAARLPRRIKLSGLDASNLYHVREAGKTFSGAALCSFGIAPPSDIKEGETVVLHLSQVADYE